MDEGIGSEPNVLVLPEIGEGGKQDFEGVTSISSLEYSAQLQIAWRGRLRVLLEGCTEDVISCKASEATSVTQAHSSWFRLIENGVLTESEKSRISEAVGKSAKISAEKSSPETFAQATNMNKNCSIITIESREPSIPGTSKKNQGANTLAPLVSYTPTTGTQTWRTKGDDKRKTAASPPLARRRSNSEEHKRTLPIDGLSSISDAKNMKRKDSSSFYQCTLYSGHETLRAQLERDHNAASSNNIVSLSEGCLMKLAHAKENQSNDNARELHADSIDHRCVMVEGQPWYNVLSCSFLSRVLDDVELIVRHHARTYREAYLTAKTTHTSVSRGQNTPGGSTNYAQFRPPLGNDGFDQVEKAWQINHFKESGRPPKIPQTTQAGLRDDLLEHIRRRRESLQPGTSMG